MKFSCHCGNIVRDSSDFQSFKASIVAEQDEEDLIDQTIIGIEQASNAFSKYTKTIYQCSTCARLWMDVKGDLISFKPEKDNCPTNLLRSNEEEQWKRHLVGKWDGKEGEVWWGFGVEDENFIASISSQKEVENIYYEAFNRLKTKNILRSSFLYIEGVTTHKWN